MLLNLLHCVLQCVRFVVVSQTIKSLPEDIFPLLKKAHVFYISHAFESNKIEIILKCKE